jgi:hypothetical protein
MWKLSSEVSGCSWCRRFFGPNTVIRGRPKCPTTTAFFFSTCGLTMRTTGSSSHRDDRRSNSCLRSRVSRSRADSFVELHLPVAVPFIVTSRNGSNGFGDGDDIWCRELSAFQSLSLLCLGFAFCRTFRPKARRPSHFSSRLIKQKSVVNSSICRQTLIFHLPKVAQHPQLSRPSTTRNGGSVGNLVWSRPWSALCMTSMSSRASSQRPSAPQQLIADE